MTDILKLSKDLYELIESIEWKIDSGEIEEPEADTSAEFEEPEGEEVEEIEAEEDEEE